MDEHKSTKNLTEIENQEIEKPKPILKTHPSAELPAVEPTITPGSPVNKVCCLFGVCLILLLAGEGAQNLLYARSVFRGLIYRARREEGPATHD